MGKSNQWNVGIFDARTDERLTIENQEQADAFMRNLYGVRKESKDFTDKMNETYEKVSQEADAAIKMMALSLVISAVFVVIPILNWYYSKK